MPDVPRHSTWILALALGAGPGPLPAQEPVAADVALTTAAVERYRAAHEVEILDDLRRLLEIPNDALDGENIRRNARYLVSQLAERGIDARLLETPGSPPAVLGELEVPGATRTVMLYAHYDGQPVTPALWSSPPWEPTLRDGIVENGAGVVDWSTLRSPVDPEWRVYGRSASDDKSPIVAMLAALDALRASGIRPSVNLKFFFEGEEERGSPHLAEMLRTHREALAADLWLFCDGPVHQSRRRQVVFGVRGVMGVGVTTYGPNRPLHSGHYGNWAPNPGVLLSHLVTRLRDENGHILIEGFYDDVRPLSAADREALSGVPPVDDSLRAELDLASTENDDAPIVERILLPALNLQGLAMGAVGSDAQNAIQSRAEAAIGFRLVPDQRPERVRELVEAHLVGLGYEIVHDEPTSQQLRSHPRVVKLDWRGGYRAMRTPLDHPVSEALLRVVDAVEGRPAIRMPTLGGSLPMYLFEEILQTPLIVLPMANHDNRQHAPNENLRIRNLWQGIELYAAVIAHLGEEWGR